MYSQVQLQHQVGTEFALHPINQVTHSRVSSFNTTKTGKNIKSYLYFDKKLCQEQIQDPS